MRIHCLALTAFGAAAMQAATAVEVPYDFIACTHSQATTLEANGDITALATQTWGTVASSAVGTQFDKASTHCMGYTRIVGGKPYGKGLCKWIFANGDTGVGEYEYGASDPKFTWLTGTGTIKGIQGGGTFAPVFNAKPAQADTSQGCRRDWGKITLPG
jgi:hypothetical protein